MALLLRTAQQCRFYNHQRKVCQEALSLMTYPNRNSPVVFRNAYTTEAGHNDKAITKILYDGECAICMMEISVLKRFNKRNNLHFVDITLPDYKPSLYNGITYEQAMKEMHVVQGKQVFIKADAIRKMYDSVGLSWLSNFTRLPVIAPFCDKLYVLFAKYRLKRALKHCDTSKCSIKLKALKEEIEGR